MLVEGLKSEAAMKYNGTEGVLLRFREEIGRWEVRLFLDKSMKSLKEENLTVLPEPEE